MRRSQLPIWPFSNSTWELTQAAGDVFALAGSSVAKVGLAWWLLVVPATSLSAQGPGKADDERVSFNVSLSDARGGGKVTGKAGDFEYQENRYLIATGGVELKHQGLELSADAARIDIDESLLTAEGHVILDEGPRRIAGDSIEWNLETHTGRVTNATAWVEHEYYFSGREIAKIDEQLYTVDDGTFTSCEEEVPPWSIHLSHAEITVGGYARIRNARWKLKKAPLIYVPYLVWPARTERTSGMLVPQPGYSNRRGVELSLAYYKTLGRIADTTFYFDVSSDQYYGFGNEVRYRPSENTQGVFEGFVLNDPDIRDLRDLIGAGGAPSGLPDLEFLPDATRWKLNWHHETNNLWGSFRGVVNFQDYSDPVYRQDFERAVGRQTNSFIYSQAYLSRNSGNQSLNLLVDLRERLRIDVFDDPIDLGELRRSGRIIDRRKQMPEIEYRIRPTRLGNAPLYFKFDGNLHYLSIENNRLDGEYGRADVFPNLSAPVSNLPWLSVKLDVGGRATYYTNSINPQTNRFYGQEDPDEKEKSLDRTFGVGGVEIVGPSFSKIFERKKPRRFSKLKHVIEPRIKYDYIDDLKDEEELLDDGDVPVFDEVDGTENRHQVDVSFINRVLAKPADEEEGGAFEVLSFSVSRAFSFDRNIQSGLDEETGVLRRTTAGPIRTILRFNPSQATSFKAEGRLNTITSKLDTLSLSGNFKLGNHSFGGSYLRRWSSRTLEETNNQLRVNASLSLSARLTFDANLSFDLFDYQDPEQKVSNPLQQRYFLSYQGSCYNLQLEFRESQFGQLVDRDFRFSFSLKNVGTFIDLNGSL